MQIKKAINFIEYCSTTTKEIFMGVYKLLILFIFPLSAIFLSLHNTNNPFILIGTFLFAMVHISLLIKYKYEPASYSEPVLKNYITEFDGNYIIREDFNQDYYIYSIILLILSTAASTTYTIFILSRSEKIINSSNPNVTFFIFLLLYSIVGIGFSIMTFTSIEIKPIKSWHKWNNK